MKTIKELWLGYSRYSLRISSSWLGFWYESWKPAWFEGRIRYITIGLGCAAFYAGDPVDRKWWWEYDS